MKRSLGRSAKRHGQIHEIWILRYPLKSLAGTHRPAKYSTQMRDAQVFGDELVLGTDIVIDADSGERFVLGVRPLVAW